MNAATRNITSGMSTILHSLIIPVFALIFTLYYKP